MTIMGQKDGEIERGTQDCGAHEAQTPRRTESDASEQSVEFCSARDSEDGSTLREVICQKDEEDELADEETPLLTAPKSQKSETEDGGTTSARMSTDHSSAVVPRTHSPAESTEQDSQLGLLTKIAFGLLMGTLYIANSSGMIIFNKFLMNEQRFPFSVCLVAMHMVSSTGLAFVLRKLRPSLFPTFEKVWPEAGSTEAVTKKTRSPMWGFVPIAIFSSMSLIMSNEAYRHSSVAFLQMMKQGMVVCIYILSVVVGLGKFLPRHVCVVTFVAISAAVTVYGEVHFKIIGFVLQLGAVFAESVKITLLNLLMTSGGKLDPLTTLHFSAPITFLCLLPALYCFWDPQVLAQAATWWPYLLCNCCVAFTLNIVNLCTVRLLSAVGFAMLAILKDVTIVIASSLIFMDYVAPLQICGFIGSVLGISTYSAMKLAPQRFEGGLFSGIGGIVAELASCKPCSVCATERKA